MPDFDARFKDDWNMNASFLDYCTGLIILMGRYAAVGDAEKWYSTIRELYRLVGGLIKVNKDARYDDRFQKIADELYEGDLIPNEKISASIRNARRSSAITMLDKLQIDLIRDMHEARLILPRTDRRSGLRVLEEEYGVPSIEDKK